MSSGSGCVAKEIITYRDQVRNTTSIVEECQKIMYEILGLEELSNPPATKAQATCKTDELEMLLGSLNDETGQLRELLYKLTVKL